MVPLCMFLSNIARQTILLGPMCQLQCLENWPADDLSSFYKQPVCRGAAGALVRVKTVKYPTSSPTLNQPYHLLQKGMTTFVFVQSCCSGAEGRTRHHHHRVVEREVYDGPWGTSSSAAWKHLFIATSHPAADSVNRLNIFCGISSLPDFTLFIGFADTFATLSYELPSTVSRKDKATNKKQFFKIYIGLY